MKKSLRTVSLLTFMLCAAPALLSAERSDPVAAAMQDPRGDYFSSESLALYPVPAMPLEMPPAELQVTVNGHNLGLFTDRNFWEGTVHFNSFEADDKISVDIAIAITIPEDVKTCRLLPEEHAPELQRQGNIIRFQWNADHNHALTLILNEDFQTAPVLHLFRNTMDLNMPTSSTPGILYFGPGYHNLKQETGNDLLTITGDQQLYLAPGAVIDGKVTVVNGDGAAVRGHGMLMRNLYDGMLLTTGGKNITYDGFMLFNTRTRCWTAGAHHVDNLRAKNLKIIATHYASTDGFDISNSRNLHFSNCFIRAADDALVIKGLDQGIPAECPPNENMLFEKMQLWNDCNNAFNMGAEARAAAYRNITLQDSDILFSYDDPHHHEKLDERSAMSISVVDGTFFENITFRNIRVYRCERLFCLTFLESFWFGSLVGNQTGPGGMKNITFANITVSGNSGSSIANEILLQGWRSSNQPGSEEKKLEQILFDSVVVENQLLQPDSPLLNNRTPELTDLHFRP